MSDIVVWHRADLRSVDNPALAAAAEDGTPAPVFVFDPQFYGSDGLACDARLRFVHESLRDLRRQYRDRGGDLALLHGDPREVIASLLDRGYEIYCNRGVTGRYGRRRDDALLDREGVTAFEDDGIVRPDERHRDGTVAIDTREDWREQCEAYFRSEPHPRPESLSDNPIESATTIGRIEGRYDVTPSKSNVPEGGTTAGRERLSAFADRLQEYPAVISSPADAEQRSSRLSAHLAIGALSPREVYRRVRDAPSSGGREMFVSRLFWNRHYTQKLADWPGWTERAVNPAMHGLFREEHDPDLVAAWKRGETGFPMVDAAMRALVETGYLNFRTRAMVASFFVYVLREWWKRGADFMYYHLIDADPAINYTQWQSQANLTGVHPVRVYDPAKQLREYDPDGTFVRRYVPELRPVPDAYLADPAKMDRATQADVGVEIGVDYPYPVVDYQRRAETARDRYAALADRADEALSDPTIQRRGSFSNRRHGREESNAERDGQASLEEFT
ncbi:FAD-binding domain-containing protein [Halapricum desulfuricans]|uniref:Deoxyribodipyrimidine photolyase n=1 Tax=Halapricum desulfuricans TaxID=2841257 RepID=A0A897MVV1_9EURY|nr:deoxyribodipyrimidine photo-lyase [Halapricum desulfuricans]QSG04607.1 Deoxyribodipyrimidine photolyase [Halapricum desulfuricans]